jgi:3-phenylpropionate/cinnamic acid dioxygenase small subunit
VVRSQRIRAERGRRRTIPDWSTRKGGHAVIADSNRRRRVNARYADAIDADRLEAWPDFFLDNARYRHVLGTPLITAAEADGLRARTSFMVARVMGTGDTMLFATGCYEDRVVLDASGGVRFAEKTVILDSRQIDTLLAIPL